MRIDVLSLFPDMFTPLTQSIIGKALERELLQFNVVDFVTTATTSTITSTTPRMAAGWGCCCARSRFLRRWTPSTRRRRARAA